ncbi:MAG: Fur family transcriptional regulator [Sulfurovaceae bacterium]|jgi:Fur family peroxide stress response transcriptional regulator|nr:Fur family transcriptional regulator [Sulfurimonas sp.]
MNNFTDELRRHNLKATPQRLAISSALHKYGHVNIDTLYEMMLGEFASISLATIYKNINLMLENSYIQEVKIPQGKTVYELTKSSHSHIVCEDCRSVEDIAIDVNSIVSKLNLSDSFVISKADLVISGVCKNCN